MGKASRWMINFFLGKKEEKCKKKDISFYAEKKTTTATVPSNPTIKRRWSFGKSAKKERGRRSIDSVITTPYLAHRSSFALPATEAIKTIVPQTLAANRIRKEMEDSAATRIQAVFARKALCALRGLVKIGELQISSQEHQYKEFCFTSQNSPSICSPPSRTIPGRASFTNERPDYASTLSNQFSFRPNYMADTESSKAKFR
uniref:DUF4005 domain-containing protein n=1 Tax=Salix viminalis TaxID=40686 RepID=A0A6N2L4F7_SALVM